MNRDWKGDWALAACKALVDAVNTTGRVKDGRISPPQDGEWPYLDEAYRLACRALAESSND